MRSRLDDPLDPDRPLIMFLGDDIDDEDHDILFPALRAHGVSVIRVHPFDLVTRLDRDTVTFHVRGREIRPDLVVGWVLDELLHPGMAHLDVVERAGIPVINDALTLLRAQNKYTNSAMLAAGGALRFPVIVGREDKALLDWFEELDGPAVTKPTVGFGGRGLGKLESLADARSYLAELPENEQYYAVPWIDNPGRDIRVYLVNHPRLRHVPLCPGGGVDHQRARRRAHRDVPADRRDRRAGAHRLAGRGNAHRRSGRRGKPGHRRARGLRGQLVPHL